MARTGPLFAFGLFAVAYSMRAVGDNRYWLDNALGAVSTFATFWCARPHVVARQRLFDLATVFVVAMIALLPVPARPIVLVAGWQFARTCVDARTEVRSALSGLAFGVACWTPVWFVVHGTAAGFAATLEWAHWLTRLSEHVPGAYVHFGARSAGVDVAILAWFIAIGLQPSKSIRGAIVAAVSVVCLQCAWVLGSAPLLRFANETFGLRGLMITDTSWVWLLVVAAWLYLVLARNPRIAPEPGDVRSSWAPVSVAVAASIACAALLPWKEAGVGAASRPRVVVHDPGYLDRRTPATDPDTFGSRASGMFGYFDTWCDIAGFDVTRQDLSLSFDPQACDVVVMINVIDPLPEATRTALEEFVESGGGLLVLADHTGFDAIREPSNQVVSRWGIEVNFDTAVAVRRSWADGVEVRPHPVTRGVNSQEQLQIWTGASLRTRWPAEPVVLGRDAFADPGDSHNKSNAYLGDMRHSIDEHLGDIVLVAAAEPKSGRVLVFGDTSPFQNLALGRSRAFADRCIRWLAGDDSSRLSTRARDAMGVIALGLVLLLALAQRADSAFATALLACAPIPSVAFDREAQWTPSRSETATIAHVDFSHAPRVTRLGWYGDGIGGLQQSLFRAGLSPFLPSEFRADLLDEASVFVCATPTRTFTDQELDLLERWIEDGGVALITLGQPHERLQRPLLERFSLQVGETPLGPAEAETEMGAMRFYDAYPTLTHPSDAVAWASVHGLPVITWLPRGRGGLVFVSDSQYLLNKNLEDDDEFIEENARFLPALVRRALEQVEAR
ncbi:MAG: ThuA domain-containing protein [Planctomycetes bacterium]|nr:ThuA domain-containing protein [Planctomycetota bacterium]